MTASTRRDSWIGNFGGLAAAAGMAMVLAGCAGSTQQMGAAHPVDPMVVAMYAEVETEPFPIPSIPVARVDPQYYRQTVVTPPTIVAAPGTIVVDPSNRFLYLVQEGGMSLRYGIGVGRQGFAWSGEAVIHDKQAWPKWFPPPEMQARDEKAAKYANGMDGGPENPLGSRALYLWQGKKDTLYRIHGTFEAASIGRAMSSGCVRMWNQDIIDLFERVPVGTKVVVLPSADAMPVDAAAPAVASGDQGLAPAVVVNLPPGEKQIEQF